MNPVDLILFALIAGATVWACYRSYRAHKKGGACGGCPSCGCCHGTCAPSAEEAEAMDPDFYHRLTSEEKEKLGLAKKR